MASLAAVVDAHLADGVPRIVPAVFGEASSPESIADAIGAFCERTLGAGVAAGEFFAASVGCVAGVRLGDRRRVVVKVHHARVSPAFLAATQRVQRSLHESGFPAPQPLVGPTAVGRGRAVAEALLDCGEVRNAHTPPVRQAMAAGLAELVVRAQPFAAMPELRRHQMVVAQGQLWPTPHDARFDFAATAAGAEWIDALGARARAVPATGEFVVGHADWRAEHLRFADGQLSAVYDWDSVIAEREPVLVGGVAHAFTANWAIAAPERQFPSLEEALAFVADYEGARGAPFSRAEHATARAALVYAMVYTARCGHSDAVLMPWGEPDPSPSDARALLAAYADSLLDHAERR